MPMKKHNFLYFTALPPTIDKFSICAEPFVMNNTFRRIRGMFAAALLGAKPIQYRAVQI